MKGDTVTNIIDLSRVAFTVRRHEWKNGSDLTHDDAVRANGQHRAAILAAIAKTPGMNLAEIMSATRIERRYCTVFLHNLQRAKVIVRSGSRGAFTYRMPHG